MEHVNLLAIGLTDSEKKLLQGVSLLSQRRETKIHLLNPSDLLTADILLVDESAPETIELFNTLKTAVKQKTVIWIDSDVDKPNQINLERPVQWSQFPRYIQAALEKHKTNQQTNPTNSVNNSLVMNTVEDQLQRVLVVDDSVLVRQQLNDILLDNGYAVTLADSGDAAINLFKPGYFSKVLLDVVMPGFNGYDVCRQIKSIDSTKDSTNVIMLTSKSSPFDKIKGKMAGCDAYLTKPVSLEKLLALLAR